MLQKAIIMRSMTSPAPPPEPALSLSLSDLSPTTKDYLLRLHAATGKPVQELIREILTGVATITTGGKAA
jgi:hypothetical protein